MNCDLQLQAQSPPSKKKDYGHYRATATPRGGAACLIGSANAIVGGSSGTGRDRF